MTTAALGVVLIIRPSRRQALYVAWSLPTGSPVLVGDRDTLTAALAGQTVDGTLPRTGHAPADRLDRADRAGTSAMWRDPVDLAYGWPTSLFILRRHPGPGGPRAVPRCLLAQYADLLAHGRTAEALTLTRASKGEGAYGQGMENATPAACL